jgi:hypothetical protein
MIIWCLGLYASASTWVFNAIREVAGPGAKTYFSSGQLNIAAFAPGLVHIVKTHEVDDAATEATLKARADRIIVTIRDPRDAVASLMQYHGHEFERALAHVNNAFRLCAAMATDKRALVMPYENKFFEAPATILTLAAHCGLALAPGQAERVFNALRREAVEQHISALPTLPGVLIDRNSGDMLDPKTHWHTHHKGRTGQMGRWKGFLSPEQVQAVQTKLADCCKFT